MKKYERNCPKCGRSIKYKHLHNLQKAETKGSNCASCITKEQHLNPERKPHIVTNLDSFRTKEFLDKQSANSTSKNNTMYGKKIYDVWIEKYGIEIANEKQKIFKEKISKATKGQNNPMYGKPSPKGSGNGWKGYYKNIYFRSLLELAFLVYLHTNNLEFENGEKRKYTIDYFFQNTQRTYRPDYIVGNIMYELKPKKLWNTLEVTAKSNAAIIWCEKHNMKYELFEPQRIDKITLKQMIIDNEVTFVEKYKLKVDNYLSK